MTNDLKTAIHARLIEITKRAESVAEFADVGFLATILSNGPWHDGMTQEMALDIFASEYA